jgi:hypothetical protein
VGEGCGRCFVLDVLSVESLEIEVFLAAFSI